MAIAGLYAARPLMPYAQARVDSEFADCSDDPVYPPTMGLRVRVGGPGYDFMTPLRRQSARRGYGSEVARLQNARPEMPRLCRDPARKRF